MEGQETAQDKETSGTVARFRYAVVDLANAEALCSEIIDQFPAIAEPLLARDSPRQLLEVSPWLVQLSKAPQIADALETFDAEDPWGFYVYASIDLISLRQRLRRLNMARLPGEDREFLFRYWDPRVMKVFLEIATEHQLNNIFEWIDRIEGSPGTFSMDRSDLKTLGE